MLKISLIISIFFVNALLVHSEEKNPPKKDSFENQNSTNSSGISVFGEKENKLKRIPGSATLIKKEDLDRIRPMDSAEVLRKVPGATIRYQDPAGVILNVGLRGVNNTLSRKVLILEDGIFTSLNPYGSPEQYYTPTIDRMEKVEIVKGSGSILFGPSTIGGVINFVTKDPPKKPKFFTKIIGGNNGFLSIQSSFGGTFGNTGIILDFLRKQGDGFRDHQSYKVHEFNIKTVTRLTQKHSLTTKLQGHNQDAHISYLGLTTSQFWNDPYLNLSEQDNRILNRFAGNVGHEWKILKKTKMITQFYGAQTERNWKRQVYTRNEGVYFNNPPNDTIKTYDTEPFVNRQGDTVYMEDQTAHRNRRYAFYGIESRLQSNFEILKIKNELDTGIRYHYDWANIKFLSGPSTPDYASWGNGFNNPPTGTISSPYSLSNSGTLRDDEIHEAKAFSVFAQNKFEFFDRIALIPGLRFEKFSQYREIRRGVNFDSNTYSNIGTDGIEKDTSGKTYSQILLPGLGVSVDLTNRFTWFSGVHKGFTPPTYQDTLDPNGTVLALKPEKSWNYETGVRGFLTYFLELQLSLFYLDYQDQIIMSSQANENSNSIKPSNVGKTTHKGSELDFTFDFGSLFKILWKIPFRVSYTYVNAKFNNYTYDLTIFNPNDTPKDVLLKQVDTNGNTIPYVSKNSVIASIGFVSPFGIYFNFEYEHFSKQYHDAFNTRTEYWVDAVNDQNSKDLLKYSHIESNADGLNGIVPAYELFNTSIGYKIPSNKWSIFLNVKNIKDTKYISSRFPEGIQPGPFRQINFGFSVEL